jgi:hypothetical protein
MNFCRKFAVQMQSYECTERKLEASLQHCTSAGEVVRNSFMNKRVAVNSKERLMRESNGHASVAYNSTGKHLERIRLNTTSSEANLPTLLYEA